MTGIRPTRPADLPHIQRIEAAAGELFRTIGMVDIADDPVPTIEALTGYQQAGLSWVAVDDNADAATDADTGGIDRAVNGGGAPSSGGAADGGGEADGGGAASRGGASSSGSSHGSPSRGDAIDGGGAASGGGAVDGDGGRPVGFVLIKVVDGHAHIEQVTVDPSHAHRRIGRDLVDHVEAWARTRGHQALTLTTFRDVAWNGPYYQRLGFTELAPTERGPELEALMAEEAAHGLDPEHRIAMIRPIQLSR